ncbi:MAG: LysM peptidoglycan-binding domain-containing protein [Treponema sp.]|nr:LysM peptidoglycan-binding domain-containing protein [Treponema sp.]
MESIGIKLADGSFYPILEDGKPEKKNLALTTVKDNQTTVHVDLYRSQSGSMDDAEYVDTLEITNLNPHGNGEPSLTLDIELDNENKLNARINDPETGLESVKNVTLVSRTPEERSMPANFSLEPTAEDEKPFEAIFNEPKNDSSDNTDMSFEEILNSISEPKEETDSNPFAITKQDVEDLDKIDMPQTEETEVLGPAPNSEDFAFDDIAASQQEESSFDLANFVTPAEDVTEKKMATEESIAEKPQDTSEEVSSEEVISEEVTSTESNFELPDFDSLTEPVQKEPAPEEQVANEQTFEEPAAVDMTDANEPASAEQAFELPDFAEATEPVQDTSTNDFELPEAFQTPTEAVAGTPAEKEDASAFELPEFEEADITMEPASEQLVSSESSSEEVSSDRAIPAETMSEQTENEDFALPEAFQTPAEDTFPDNTFKNPFDLSGFDDSTPTTPAGAVMDDTVISDTSIDNTESDATLEDTTDRILPDEGTFKELASNEDTSEPVSLSEMPSEENAFNLPDFSDADTNVAESSTGTSQDFDLPDFSNEPAATDTSLDLPDFGNLDSPNDSLFDLPDFNNTTNANERVIEPLGIDTSDDFSAFDLPDFDDDSSSTDFTLPDFDEAETNTDFVLPDFDRNVAQGAVLGAASGTDTITPQNMFSDLYDKETLEGKSSSAYDDYPDNKKQSKVPVVICLVCALICLLSLLFLFVLPTNLNIITRTQAIAQKTELPETASNSASSELAINEEASKEEASKKATSTEAAPSSSEGTSNASTAQSDGAAKSSAKQPKETVAAKENEIVIASVPSQVVPEKPARPVEKLPDTKYTVVWGDTLWDISNAYYKNPWRYTYLAEYNHLKNPNYIKAGSVILIPAE